MKKLLTIIVAFSGLVLFNGCSKEAPEPDLNPIENTSQVQGTCRNYWYYSGSQIKSLGDPWGNQIIIGFKKGTNQAKKLKILNNYPELNTLINSTQWFGDDLTNVSLQPNLSCADIGDLIENLETNNHIDFVGPYFTNTNTIFASGLTNSIIVVYASNTTQADLNNLIKVTKTEYVEEIDWGVHIYKTTKHSPKNTLDTAKQFYESGLFNSAEPGFYVISTQ